MRYLREGAVLLDYRIVRVLGSGGFGVTYLALDEQLGRQFAIKEYFPSEFAVREDRTVHALEQKGDDFLWGKARFVEEARTLARFDHPNIVKAVRIFDANNTSYMVQEYQSGRDLRSWAASLETPPNQEELDLLLAPLLDALALVHRNGVLHRDLSPDNIYIRDDGTPVLLDFGSARQAVAARTETVSAMVKSGYSPAEQYSTKAKSQGPWSDIYSFAATIYSVVSGAAPEPATERLLEDGYTPLKVAARGAYRQPFLDAIDWGLQLAPEKRPQSIGEWSRELFREIQSKPNEYVAKLLDEPVIKQISTSAPRSERKLPIAKKELDRSLNATKIASLVVLTIGVLIAGIAFKDHQASTEAAQQLASETKSQTLKNTASEAEKNAWQNTSFFDKEALRAFIRKYPASQYRSVAEHRIELLEKEAQRKVVPPTPVAQPSVSFTFSNSVGLRVGIRFYDGSKRQQIDPEQGQHALSIGKTQTYKVPCQSGVNICFGAWGEREAFQPFWGVGRNGDQACSDCCLTCRSSSIPLTQDLSVGNSRVPLPTVTWKITDRTSSRLSIAFYSETRKGVGWPGGNESWPLIGTETTHVLPCVAGERICYGAWRRDDLSASTYWGGGRMNLHGCEGCCTTCDGGEFPVTLTD
ncbi:MAG: serine/threonine protein kinase [Rhodopseudomonas palustris]|nr:MAG: serine/threonine protein kinase [Rhodopseudomonas palustris]